ncbi:MAG: Hsp20/alpha crystallin family protein [bacterium]
MAETESQTALSPRRQGAFSDVDLPGRWRPFRSLLDDLLMDRAQEWGLAANGGSSLMPSVDITETDEEYRVRAELPGVSKDDVTVELEQGVLSIRGEKKSVRDEKLERGRRRECSYGSFSRSFTLPQDAEDDKVSAEFKDGVLEVKIGKGPESKPKRIEVQG